jgi:outer membrane protein
MKKKLLLRQLFCISILFLAPALYGQKIGYIDSGFILAKMPEYKEAQTAIDKLSQTWQSELEKLKQEIDKANLEYKAEEILLTDQMKQERLKEIEKKNQLYAETNKKYFGYQGLLFLKRQELIKPVQDKVFEAVEKVCRAKRIDFLLDKSADLTLLYTNPVHDYTDFVLEELGLAENEQEQK